MDKEIQADLHTADGNAGQWNQESAGQIKEGAQPGAIPPGDVDIVEEVKTNLAFVLSYESIQRAAEEEESIFEGEDMWREDDRESRAEFEDEDDHKVVERPALSVPLHEQHINTIVNEARQARLALTVKPRTGIALSKTAEYIKGLMMFQQNNSGALSIRIHALERTAKIGRGFYKLTAKYANDGDFDLDVELERILDQSTVYLDPYRTRADNEDMGWAIESEKISEADRKRRWPLKPIIEPTGGWIATEASGDWFSVEGEESKQTRLCRVATYYRVEYEEFELGYHARVGTMPVKDMPADVATAVMTNAEGTRRRTVQKRKVAMYVVDGTQVLERSEWRGRYIPLIGTVGKEYFLRHRRRYKGVICSTMDILRAINVVLSSAIEVAGQMPRAPYIMYAGQDAGHEEMWDNLPVRNYTRVYVEPMTIDGKPAPLPARQMLEPAIQGLMLLLRVLQDFFNAVTGGVAPSQRAVNPYDRSGKAIEALQRQGAAGTSNYLDNLATISMPYEGKCWLSAIAGYYDTPGRIVRVSSDDSEDETAIMIKQPFTRDVNGMPVPVPCPTCQGRGIVPATAADMLTFRFKPKPCPACKGSKLATKENMPEIWDDQTVEYVNFADGEFSVVPAIDRNYQAKQEEALLGMSDLAKAAPELVPAYAATWVRAMGFSGANKVADAIEAAYPTPGKEFGNEKIPPRALAALTKLQQEHEMAMQALSEAQKIIETDQIKGQTSKDIEILRQAFNGKLETLKAQNKMMQTKVDAESDIQVAALKGSIERMMQESEHRHEMVMQLLKEQGEKEIERHAAGIHAEAEAVAHARLTETGDLDHRRTLSENEQKARHAAEQTDQKGAQASQQIDKKGAQAVQQTGQKGAIQKDLAAQTHEQSLETQDRAHEQTLETQEQAAKLAPKKPEPKK